MIVLGLLLNLCGYHDLRNRNRFVIGILLIARGNVMIWIAL